MKDLTRRYFVSTFVTFLTGFGIVIVADIDSLTLQSFQDGTFIGVLFAAVRAGFKAVIEAFLATRTDR